MKNMLRVKLRFLLHFSWAQVGKTEYLNGQKYQNVHACDSGSHLRTASRNLSRKPTPNVPRNNVSLHLQIFDFGREAWITKLHLLDSKVLAQQLSIPSPMRDNHIQTLSRDSLFSSQHFHRIFNSRLGISLQVQESLFRYESTSVPLQVLSYLGFSSLSLCRQEMRIFHPYNSHVLYHRGTSVTYAVLAKSSGMLYTIKPSPVLEEDSYFFCVCINILTP